MDEPERSRENEEVLDGLPVLTEVHAVEPMPVVSPAVQTAAAAATGFLAGAATLALLRRRSTRRLATATLRSAQTLRPSAHGTSRTYLVRVISRPLD